MIPYQFHKKKSSYSQDTAINADLSLSIFRNKPFWILDKEKHRQEFLNKNGQCCFNHLIGLPTKNDREYPIFDYEIDIINKIQNYRNIWIKKASGIGITELVL